MTSIKTLSQLFTPAEWLLNHEKTSIALIYFLAVGFWYGYWGIGLGWSLVFGLLSVLPVGTALLMVIGLFASCKALIDSHHLKN